MMAYRVASVDEAIIKARELCETQGYDWFRGQVRPHPPNASLYRLSEEEYAEATEQMAHFEHWARKQPELKHLTTDEILAIGQHHGLKTPFLDFTTDIEVAAFFACDTKTPPPDGTRSRIYLVNSGDFLEFFQDIRRVKADLPQPELITLDIPELWRLNAQKGVFLFTGGVGWEHYYDLDFIDFPYTGPVATPTRDEIYPSRSSLEKLIDRFFILDRDRKNHRVMDELRKSFHVIDFSAAHTAVQVAEHPSWDSGQLWRSLSAEVFATAQHSATVPLLVDLTLPPTLLQRRITDGVQSILLRNPSARQDATRWQLDVHGNDPGVNSLESLFMQVWDGTRCLPYSDGDIAACLGTTVALFKENYQQHAHPLDPTPDRIANATLGPAIAVGFTARDGIGSYGHVGIDAALAALRPDLQQVLATANIPCSLQQSPSARLTCLFQYKPDPRVLFDFEHFARAFVRTVVPTQAVRNHQRYPVLFSAAEITTFGLP